MMRMAVNTKMIHIAILLTMASKVMSVEPSPHTHLLARANNEFALHLYQVLRAQNEGENLFFSPLSISTALGMTHLGARGSSADQIGEVLHFNQLEEFHLHDSFKQLNSLLVESASKNTLRAANKLYGKSGSKLLQEFLDGTGHFYNSVFESVEDFTDPAVAEKINDWVSKQTENRIKDLISPGVLNALTRLVLVNAIYFKGDWEKQFDPEETRPGIFKLPHETVALNMMRQTGKFLLSDDKTRRCFVLELPYLGENLSMLAVLPYEDGGLALVEDQLSLEAFDFWENDLEEEKVRLQFPKFKFDNKFSLKSTLASMGMTYAFEAAKANFEGITGDRSLHISEVIHKAFIEVNEEGSEAAGASGVVMMARSLSRPYTLNYDRPFLFLIRDRQTRAVLFMGRMVDPPLSSHAERDEL